MKIFIAAIVLIPALLFGGVMLLLDNPDFYQDELSSIVKAQTGFDLTINGEIKWRYWPPIAIDVTGVELRPSGAENTLMTLDNVAVDLKLLPLIFGAELAIDGLTIDGLTVNAKVDAEGKGNWEVPGNSADADVAAENGDSSNVKLDIAGISISNANISYVEQATAIHYVILINALTTGPVRYDELTRMDFDMIIEDKPAKLRSEISGSGNLAFNAGFTQYQFKALAINTKTSMPDMGDIPASVTLNGSADLQAGTLVLAESNFSVAEIAGSTSLNVTDLNGAPTLQGKLQITPFAIKPLMARLKLEPIETNNPDVLGSFGLTADISGTMPKLGLTNLNMQLDSSTIKGRIDADLGDKLKAGFDLAIDHIILSDYLGPNVVPAEETAAAAPTDSEAIPVELLNTYELDGKLSIGKITYDTYALDNLVIEIVNRQQKLTVSTTASGYDGQISFNFDAQTPVTGAVIGATKMSITGLNITKLTAFEWITGSLDLDSQTSFKGKMLSQVLNTLTGDNRFTINNGTLDVTPIKSATAVVDGLRGKTSSVATWPDKMPFESLAGNLALQAGIKANQQLNVQVETMLITGTGGVDYWNNQLAYDIGITLQESSTSQFSVKPPMAGLRWPLHCEGAMDASPVDLCLPNMKGVQNLVADLLKQEVQRQGTEKIVEKLQEQLSPDMQDKAKSLLKGLFGT
ncbi:MAG: AsmA protein [Cyclobacteriaceae bacterium]|jgi:AsmA protein